MSDREKLNEEFAEVVMGWKSMQLPCWSTDDQLAFSELRKFCMDNNVGFEIVSLSTGEISCGIEYYLDTSFPSAKLELIKAETLAEAVCLALVAWCRKNGRRKRVCQHRDFDITQRGMDESVFCRDCQTFVPFHDVPQYACIVCGEQFHCPQSHDCKPIEAKSCEHINWTARSCDSMPLVHCEDCDSLLPISWAINGTMQRLHKMCKKCEVGLADHDYRS